MSNNNLRLSTAFICLSFYISAAILFSGCATSRTPSMKEEGRRERGTKVFLIILDALKRNTLFDSLDSLPQFKVAIKGAEQPHPYIYFENALVSIPSSSRPVNTTLLTGVYPLRHGVPQTLWFDRKRETVRTLTSLSQRRIVDILEETRTDTLFDYASRSGKTAMAVTTMVTKGVQSQDLIKQGVHLWSQAFFVNLFKDGNAIPDGAHLDRGTTKGLLNGYLYSFSDGLKGRWKTSGDIPDLVVIHYVGLDLFTHYPPRFMVKENWSIEQIQTWYLQAVLDPEIGKIMDFLKDQDLFEDSLFIFVSDHGQTKIEEYVDEGVFEEMFTQRFRLMGRPYSAKEAQVVVIPGASTKTMYIRNGMESEWFAPPRLFADLKPVVDVIVDSI